MSALSPITMMMLAGEAQEGREPIWPNNAPHWLDPSDWHGWPVLAIANGELHIVAIWSARKGALTRLLEGARAAGLSPVVVCPVGREMPAILKHWGWQRKDIGEGWTHREEWRPRLAAKALGETR